MRRELIQVFFAVSSMIVVAFVVPLGLSARSTAMDTAMDRARSESASLVPLVAADNHQLIDSRLDELNRSGDLRVTLVMHDGDILGFDRPIDGRLRQSLDSRVSLAGPIDGGYEITTVVSTVRDRPSVIAMMVDEQALTRGVGLAWLVLGLLAVAMVLLAVALADRLAVHIVGPSERLGAAVAALGNRNFDVHLTPDGPPELAATARAFNVLTGRVQSMLDEERGLMAELAHRLRTPLARLRIDVEQVEDEGLALRLNRDIDALTQEVNDLIVRVRQSIDPPSPIDMTALARDRFDFWAQLAVDEGRNCHFVGAETVKVEIDPDDAESVVDALIENVFAHTDPGVGFRVTVDGADEACRLMVEDGGPGFESGLVGNGRSEGGSTGMGLAIVRRLADRHRGSLSVDRGDDGGSRVTWTVRALR